MTDTLASLDRLIALHQSILGPLDPRDAVVRAYFEVRRQDLAALVEARRVVEGRG